MKKFINLVKEILICLSYISYLIIGLINVIVLLNAISIKFHVGLLLSIFISLIIGNIPMLGSAFTVWGGCVWLGLNVIQSMFFFFILPLILILGGGALMDGAKEND